MLVSRNSSVSRSSWCAAHLLILIGAVSGTVELAWGQAPPRLGPPQRNLGDSQLPPVPANRYQSERSRPRRPLDATGAPRVRPGVRPRLASQAGDRDLVFFAADSFEAPVPLSWQVQKTALGRDVRLVLSPSRFEGNRLPHDCIWVSYTVDAVIRSRPLGALLEERARVHSALSAGELPSRATTISRFPAMLTERLERDREGTFEVGHMLVATDWCLFEIHWTFPQSAANPRRPMIQNWLREIKLTPPAVPEHNLPPQIASALAVVGSWKSFRSRLRFYKDGRVTILMDSAGAIRVDGTKPKKAERLIGTYQGQGDLVYVVWDDGSKLNFRWRVEGDRLLLTDHEGHVSQLRRLLE